MNNTSRVLISLCVIIANLNYFSCANNPSLNTGLGTLEQSDSSDSTVTAPSNLAKDSVTAQEDSQMTARQLTESAVQLVDKGKPFEALGLLRKAVDLDPSNDYIRYELALAYYVAQDYNLALKLLKPLARKSTATPHNFQALGNTYHYLEKPKKALRVYKDGLKRFPNSGPLHLEQGLVYLAEGKVAEAVASWTDGVDRDPTFPSNYFWLAKLYSDSDKPLWTLIFGEMFINLEDSTARTTEISKLLIKVYRESISINGNKVRVNLIQNQTINIGSLLGGGEFKPPFSLSFELAFSTAVAIELTELSTKSSETPLPLFFLAKVRSGFIDSWFRIESHSLYRVPLIEWQRIVRDAGHFDAYTYWIFDKGNPDETTGWQEANKTDMDLFTEWIQDNNMQATEGWIRPLI